jgi:integrase
MMEEDMTITEHVIVRNGVRILRPHEITSLINAIPKMEHRIRFETLLYTGCRYVEVNWLHKHPEAFDGNAIRMPSTKTEAREKERYIKLNLNGKRTVTLFLRDKKGLPAQSVWDRNLIRWAEKSGLSKDEKAKNPKNPYDISSKSTRKTWESWLVTMYPQSFNQIVISQGHTKETSMETYLGLPFSPKDKEDMPFYTEGWL